MNRQCSNEEKRVLMNDSAVEQKSVKKDKKKSSKKSKKRRKEKESSDEEEWMERVTTPVKSDDNSDEGAKKKRSKKSKKLLKNKEDEEEEKKRDKKAKKQRKEKKRNEEKEESSNEEEWMERVTTPVKSDDNSDEGSKKKRSNKSKKLLKDKEDEEEEKKRDKKAKKQRKEKERNEEEEKQEQKSLAPSSMHRDDWMTGSLGFMMPTYTRERKEAKKPNAQQPMEQYDPSTSSRELNRNWQNNGTGLPAFLRPNTDDDADDYPYERSNATQSRAGGARNWQKPSNDSASNQSSMERNSGTPLSAEALPSYANATYKKSETVTDFKLNKMATNQFRANLSNNLGLSNQIRQNLTDARSDRAINPPAVSAGEVQKEPKSKQQHNLLTCTDSSGNMRPMMQSSNKEEKHHDKHSKKKTRKETHDKNGERLRYHADDDNYSLKEMFEREKLEGSTESDAQFARIVSKHKNPNDDLDDIFADEMRTTTSKSNDQNEMHRVIRMNEKVAKSLENCQLCYDSHKINRDLVISVGDNIVLTLPSHVGLQAGHCVLSPKTHVSTCTQLDENVWEELTDYRKALTRMYGQDCIFYEIANNLHKRPHLTVHCIPIPPQFGESAPFYIKKAFEESETLWSVNKQLISLQNKSLRSAIPRGLPYIWVNFGMGYGFAHVIEDRERFPSHFISEIIAGMMNLDRNIWRKPSKLRDPVDTVQKFILKWKPYDFIGSR